MTGIQNPVEQISDLKAAVALGATGTGGSFAQAITEWSNNIVAGGNALLILGGLYLMYHKIKDVHWKAQKRNRRKDDDG